MKATQLLHNLGQCLRLDNISHDLLNNGTLERYFDGLPVTGLSSNPAIFDQAIRHRTANDGAILEGLESETKPRFKQDSSTNNLIRRCRKMKGAL
jgi:transaldolase